MFVFPSFQTVHAVAENQKDETDSTELDSGCIQQYKCLWEGCKVYGKGSSSKVWLEKHVLSHGGNKPFQCIVDGCKQRFGTQVSSKLESRQRPLTWRNASECGVRDKAGHHILGFSCHYCIKLKT